MTDRRRLPSAPQGMSARGGRSICARAPSMAAEAPRRGRPAPRSLPKSLEVAFGVHLREEIAWCGATVAAPRGRQNPGWCGSMGRIPPAKSQELLRQVRLPGPPGTDQRPTMSMAIGFKPVYALVVAYFCACASAFGDRDPRRLDDRGWDSTAGARRLDHASSGEKVFVGNFEELRDALARHETVIRVTNPTIDGVYETLVVAAAAYGAEPRPGPRPSIRARTLPP